MNIRRHTYPLILAFGMSLLAACSADSSDTAATGQAMVLYASVDEPATTRSTVDNTWTVGDLVALNISKGDASVVKQYCVTNAATGRLDGNGAENVYFWEENSSDAVSIAGWFPYAASLPSSVSVAADQSTADKLQAQDFLYAPAKDISPTAVERALTFYHQLARVTFRVKLADPENGMTAINGATLGTTASPFRLNGTFTAPTGSATYGTWAFGSSTGVITPCETTAPYGFVKAYTALVIPGTYPVGTALLSLAATEGDYTYLVADNALTLTTGGSYTFDVTVENSSIIVRLVGSIVGWGQVGRNIQAQQGTF